MTSWAGQTVCVVRLVAALGLVNATIAPASRVGAADDPCADLAAQAASADQQLDQARSDALPWLTEGSQRALSVPSELLVAAAAGSLLDLTPQLAETYGALAVQVGTEMQLVSTGAGADSSAAFMTQLGQRLNDWEARLALVTPLGQYSPSLQALQTALQSLDQVEAPALGTLAIRDDLHNRLAACQPQTPPSTAAGPGCGLSYFGLDRSAGLAALRPAVPGLSSDVTPGQQWDVPSTDVVSRVTTVDTYACTPDGATKVGRTAEQSFPDGTTSAWGERDYEGTLWPKTIAPGATWQWQAIQYTLGPDGAPDYEETWQVSVRDVGREPLLLPSGRFEAIHLQLDEDIIQPDQTQHVSWDEWYARPVAAN